MSPLTAEEPNIICCGLSGYVSHYDFNSQSEQLLPVLRL